MKLRQHPFGLIASKYPKTFFYIAFIFIVSILLYSNTFFNDFTAEDHYLISNNEFIKDISNIRILFSPKQFIKPFSIRNGARPLTVFSLMLDHALWGERPFGYHLTNVLIHALNSCFLFFLFRVYRINKKISFFAATIFMMHPIQGEVVNVPGFRGDLLSVFFIILMYIFLALAFNYNKKTHFLYAVIFYLAALMSKEVVILAPVSALVYFLHGKILKKKTLSVFSIVLLALGPLYLIGFWKPRYNYSIFNIIISNIKGNTMPYSSLPAYINTITHSLLHYIKSIIFPFYLSYDYQFAIKNTFSFEFVVVLILLFVTGIYFIRKADGFHKMMLLTLLFLYLPVSNILPLFNTVADRFMYVPMIPVSLLLAEFFYIIQERTKGVFKKIS